MFRGGFAWLNAVQNMSDERQWKRKEIKRIPEYWREMSRRSLGKRESIDSLTTREISLTRSCRNLSALIKWKISPVYWNLPWSQRSFLIFLRERDQEQTAKAKATRRERKTSGYLGLESHFHADYRVRIWPSGVDWLIVFQTRKPIWLARLIVTTEGTLRIFTPHFASLY